jgi:hypothetical protein
MSNFEIELDDDLLALLLQHARAIPDEFRDSWFSYAASVIRPQMHRGDLDHQAVYRACKDATRRYMPATAEVSNGG